jgi:hypothetical protein
MTVILATWEAEIRRILVQGQLGQRVYKNPISKIPEQNRPEVWLKW